MGLDRKPEPTIVIFRVFTTKPRDLIALMPELDGDGRGTILSYMHIGQHSGAHYDRVIDMSRPAKPDEYADLLAELQRIGYDPIIRQRHPKRRRG